jgi:hypothetical protein
MRLQYGKGSYRCCDGVSRRDVLRIGALSALGLTLPDLLRMRAASAARGKETRKTSCILIWQGGGPSHLDMWDPKPEAPLEFRGPFGTLPTSVSGIRLSEHLPLSARVMQHYSLIRSLTHPESEHNRATHFMLTGYLPTVGFPDQEMPSYGSIVARVRGAVRPGMPPYVTVPQTPRSGNAGYLGVAYNPFAVGTDPNDRNYKVRNLALPAAVTEGRFADRRSLLGKLDTFSRRGRPSELMHGMDAFKIQAAEMVTSAEARMAFDLTKEADKLRDGYGRTKLGQSCLLARRLVEAGVTFVTIDDGGWDTHTNNFEELKNNRLPPFDRAWSALVSDLADRGLLETTLVMAVGEFGRTPRINSAAGRDHWPAVMSVALAGGGIRGGVVVGESDARAESPQARPVTEADLLTTMYTLLGIDPLLEFRNEAGRPLRITPGGEVIRELV